MSTQEINAIGVLVGNPDEIVFVLTKDDVERVYNMMNNLNLGTHLPESVWSSFKENNYRLDDRLDHAAAIEDILAEYCRVPASAAPPPPASASAAPPPPASASAAPSSSAPPAYADWDTLQRKKYDTKKFYPPGYGNYVVWSAHRVRAFMLALKKKPTVYDSNLRTLADLAGVHPYDFRWKTNPVTFGLSMGLSDYQMRQMMGSGYNYMNDRFFRGW